MKTSNTDKTVEWNNLPWREIETVIFKLQKRIYQASKDGNIKAVRKLQKTLTNSWYAKLLSVRKVTQDNTGKNTAGIDGVKSLTPPQRLQLAKDLKIDGKSKPTRRVWIPKPGKAEKRPLGIPVMEERAKQALVKLALEPEWEAKFEPNSFGFRPGRSCHDAIGQVYMSIKQKAKYALDADIAGCFDNIDHDALLEKVNTYPKLQRQLKAWLKSGVIDWKAYAHRPKQRTIDPTTKGTPQGGVISPLLANIALHGLELTILSNFPKRNAPNIVRYADDFVILHENLEVILKCQEITVKFLKGIGLELKPSKTTITHTLNKHQNKVGFDFLGFEVRQYKVGKHQSGKINGKLLGFKTLIKPSKDQVNEHFKTISDIIKNSKAKNQAKLIERLNPIIKGWSNYYSTVVSKAIYNKLDALLYWQLVRWGLKRHPSKSKAWVSNRYWHSIDGWKRTFATRESEGSLRLIRHIDKPIKRHSQIQRNKSPYDGDWIYWSKRRGNYPGTPSTVAYLIKEQKGKCPHCNLNFFSDDLLEVHHKDKNRKNNRRTNLEILHRHCHDYIHKQRYA